MGGTTTRVALVGLAALAAMLPAAAVAKVAPESVEVTEQGGIILVSLTMPDDEAITAGDGVAEPGGFGYAWIHPVGDPEAAEPIALRPVGGSVFEGIATPGEGDWVVRTLHGDPVEVTVGDAPPPWWLALPTVLLLIGGWVLWSRGATPGHDLSPSSIAALQGDSARGDLGQTASRPPFG